MISRKYFRKKYKSQKSKVEFFFYEMSTRIFSGRVYIPRSGYAVRYSVRHRLARHVPYSLAPVSLAAQTRATRRPHSGVTNTKYAGEKCSVPLAAPRAIFSGHRPRPDESLSDATNEPRIIFTRALVFPRRCRRTR